MSTNAPHPGSGGAAARMAATRIEHGLMIGGKVKIVCIHGGITNYWLSIEGPKGETHQIRVTRGGKVIVTSAKGKAPTPCARGRAL